MAMRTHARRVPMCGPVASLFVLCATIASVIVTSRGESTLPSTSRADHLPAPIVGTWIRLRPEASSAVDGMPIGRCDHTFVALNGLAQPNSAVPFPNQQRPLEDPFNNQFWLFGGHTDDVTSHETPSRTARRPIDPAAADSWIVLSGARFFSNFRIRGSSTSATLLQYGRRCRTQLSVDHRRS
jgi:hypothetical protein